MSPVRVITDGQIVDRSAGDAAIGNTGRSIALGFSRVEMAGAIIPDDEVDRGLLELVKSGDGPAGLVYFESEEDAEAQPVELSPEAQAPQNDQDLDPGRDNDGSGQESAYKDDPAYDPDKHVQAQVLEYLKGASPDEVERVKVAEADGQNRQQIAAYAVPSTEPASFEE